MLPVWIYALTAVAASGSYATKKIYKTPLGRASLVGNIRSTPALQFLYGQVHGNSPGAIMAWRYLVYAALGAALMSIFLVVRHTRADEETGRLELIGSTVVGRHAPLAVAMLVASAASLLLCVLTAAVLVFTGLPVIGAIAFGLAEAGCGLAFAGDRRGSRAGQRHRPRGAGASPSRCSASSSCCAGVGDSGGSHGLTWLTWLSPIGWAELARPFGAERWWVLALPVLTVLAGIGHGVRARRAARSGRWPDAAEARAGDGRAARCRGRLGSAGGCSAAAVAGWTAGFLVGGLAIGRGDQERRQASRVERRRHQGDRRDRRAGSAHQRLPGGLHEPARPGRGRVRRLRGRAAAGRRGGGPRRAAAGRAGEQAALGRQPPAGRRGRHSGRCSWLAASASVSRSASRART